jgi:hypothetical protein
LKVWNESTTTIPSGLHLGHDKSITKPIAVPDNPEATKSLKESRNKLLTAQVQLTNFATHGHVYEHWEKVANFMILKEQGNTKIHRLCVIHLYEADLKW